MPRKPKPDASIKEIMIVEDPAAIKLLFTPKYAEIIRLVEAEELSVSDVARKLDVNPGSAHYHMKELEKHGLVRLVREEIAGGVVRKYYRKSARGFVLGTSTPASTAAAAEMGIDDAFKEKLIRSMSFFGYDIPPGKMEEAKKILMTADARCKAIIADVQDAGLEKAEADRNVVSNAYQIAMLLRLMNDEQFIEATKKFTGSFSRVKKGKTGEKK
jgi:DNA-binding transcriptional ArsR family regulator